MKERFFGIILALIGIAEMMIFPEDATAGFFLILLSVCLLFGKQDRIRPI